MAMRTATMFESRLLAAVMAGLAAAPAGAAQGGGTEPSRTAITCTNPVGGAVWQIVLDYRNATVDSNPAEITRAKISWFDPRDGGNYTLDRRSGALRASVASSTGGYFRYARCSLGEAR